MKHWRTFGANPCDPFAVVERCLTVMKYCALIIGVSVAVMWVTVIIKLVS